MGQKERRKGPYLYSNQNPEETGLALIEPGSEG